MSTPSELGSERTDAETSPRTASGGAGDRSALVGPEQVTNTSLSELAQLEAESGEVRESSAAVQAVATQANDSSVNAKNDTRPSIEDESGPPWHALPAAHLSTAIAHGRASLRAIGQVIAWRAMHESIAAANESLVKSQTPTAGLWLFDELAKLEETDVPPPAFAVEEFVVALRRVHQAWLDLVTQTPVTSALFLAVNDLRAIRGARMLATPPRPVPRPIDEPLIARSSSRLNRQWATTEERRKLESLTSGGSGELPLVVQPKSPELGVPLRLALVKWLKSAIRSEASRDVLRGLDDARTAHEQSATKQAPTKATVDLKVSQPQSDQARWVDSEIWIGIESLLESVEARKMLPGAAIRRLIVAFERHFSAKSPRPRAADTELFERILLCAKLGEPCGPSGALLREWYEEARPSVAAFPLDPNDTAKTELMVEALYRIASGAQSDRSTAGFDFELWGKRVDQLALSGRFEANMALASLTLGHGRARAQNNSDFLATGLRAIADHLADARTKRALTTARAPDVVKNASQSEELVPVIPDRLVNELVGASETLRRMEAEVVVDDVDDADLPAVLKRKARPLLATITPRVMEPVSLNQFSKPRTPGPHNKSDADDLGEPDGTESERTETDVTARKASESVDDGLSHRQQTHGDELSQPSHSNDTAKEVAGEAANNRPTDRSQVLGTDSAVTGSQSIGDHDVAVENNDHKPYDASSTSDDPPDGICRPARR